MQYHSWSPKELEQVRKYIDRTFHPLSERRLVPFAEKMGVSKQSARGAIHRMMLRMRDEPSKVDKSPRR